jgi:glycerol uptake facilitator protein
VEASGRTTSGATTAARWRDDDDLERRGIDAYAAEFLGTLLLVFFVGVIVTLNSAGGLGFTDWAVIGLLHFLVLGFLVHTLGGSSGAHFNPAVTATLAALRKIHLTDAAIYVVLQIAGALAGALLVKLLLSDEGEPVGYGAPEVSDGFLQGDALPGFLAELIGTFVLMWAIMGVAVNPRGARDWAGFTIGGALGFAVMALGPLTGAGLNPARAFGPALVGDKFGDGGTFIVAYVLGPLVGALLAGVLYVALILQPQRRGEGRRPVDTLSGDAEDRRGGEDIELPPGAEARRRDPLE